MRQAYLIIAHNNLDILKKKILLLDDENTDFYIHIDKKTKNFDPVPIRDATKKSKVHFIKRTNVTWGGYSLIKCEIDLLRAAGKEHYDFYHLLSGVDMPIKRKEEITRFFEENKGKEFVHFDRKDFDPVLNPRLAYYHFFHDIGFRSFFMKKAASAARQVLLTVQKLLGVNRIKNCPLILQKGANWFSITDALAHHVVSREDTVKKLFSKTHLCEEIFLQTLVVNSPFKDNLFYKGFDDSYISIMRHIDWKRGKPYVFGSGDFEELINSDKLFARKFDLKKDPEIVEKLYEYLK